MNIIRYVSRNALWFVAALLIIAAFVMVANAATLTRQLEFGMQGDDVAALQAFLAADPTIYPEGLVTGYFGPLTKAAVERYQTRNGIAAVGRVGPVTLAAIQSQSGIGGSDDVSAPLISNINIATTRSSATITWSTNEETTSVLHYSTSLLTLSEIQRGGMSPAGVTVSGTAADSLETFHMGHAAYAQNLQPNTTYYYVIYAEDRAGNVSVTWASAFRTKE